MNSSDAEHDSAEKRHCVRQRLIQRKQWPTQRCERGYYSLNSSDSEYDGADKIDMFGENNASSESESDDALNHWNWAREKDSAMRKTKAHTKEAMANAKAYARRLGS